MNDCTPKLLVEGSHYNIAQCPHCNRIGLYYHNVLIGFDFDDFCRYAYAVLKVDFDCCSIWFPDEKEHVVLNTSCHDIQLSFTREEFEEFTGMLNQSLLLIEAGYYANK